MAVPRKQSAITPPIDAPTTAAMFGLADSVGAGVGLAGIVSGLKEGTGFGVGRGAAVTFSTRTGVVIPAGTTRVMYAENPNVFTLIVLIPVSGSTIITGGNGCGTNTPFTSLCTLNSMLPSANAALVLSGTAESSKGSAIVIPGSGNTVPVGPKKTADPTEAAPAGGAGGFEMMDTDAGPASAGQTPAGMSIEAPSGVPTEPPRALSISASTLPKVKPMHPLGFPGAGS
mmetsp:Transcript_18175/g.26615  ORF Transcript_18175/g.26615 Transcript_18175/m.26615 type:complete len:229 (-) Transcript_18175:4198-4884(-)